MNIYARCIPLQWQLWVRALHVCLCRQGPSKISLFDSNRTPLYTSVVTCNTLSYYSSVTFNTMAETKSNFAVGIDLGM